MFCSLSLPVLKFDLTVLTTFATRIYFYFYFYLNRIPRDEVKGIHRVIVGELDELQPGCVSTIVGG